MSKQDFIFPICDEQDKLTGTEISLKLEQDRFKRELQIEEFVNTGHVPAFLSLFCPVTITSTKLNKRATILVSPDYLSLGTDDDYLRVPLFPTTAQRIADKYNCLLPTKKIVDEIWKSSKVKVEPKPWGPPYDSSMMSTYRIIEHNKRINSDLKDYTSGNLIGGHKKDVIICNELTKKKDRVAIYGWHHLNGLYTQQVYLGHENTYTDYSHGIRMVSRLAFIDDETEVDLCDILIDKDLSELVSHEGSLQITKYVY